MCTDHQSPAHQLGREQGHAPQTETPLKGALQGRRSFSLKDQGRTGDRFGYGGESLGCAKDRRHAGRVK